LAATRLLHVITGLGTGGAERALVRLVLSQPPAARPVAVVSLASGGRYAEILRQGGIEVIELGMRPGLPSPAGLLRLIRAIRRLAPDIVQSWMYHADLAALVALALSGRWRRTRLYWGVRCSDMDLSKYPFGTGLVVRLCAKLSGLPTAVAANSASGRDHHRRIGYRPRIFAVVDNGIDPAPFAPDADARREVRTEFGIADETVAIAMLARVDPMKDHAGFLSAFARLRGATALLIGTDTETLAETPGIHRLGERRDIPRLLAACDILVSSSAFGEGFSNAIIEGMAAGLAVVATDVGDSRRILGDAGEIVPPRDPAALAAALQGLIDDPERRRALGAAARRRVETDFSLARTRQAWAAFYAGEKDAEEPEGKLT